jgi:methyl-accepting chemotaxis protein
MPVFPDHQRDGSAGPCPASFPFVLGLIAALAALACGAAVGQPLSATYLGLCCAAGVLVGAVAAVGLRVYFVKPLEALRDDIRAMHRDGDLSRRVGLSGGVIGEAELAFNDLIGSFQGIVGKVIFDAQRVFEAAALLEGHAGRVAEGPAPSGQRPKAWCAPSSR